MYPGGSNFENDLYANVPSMAMMNMMYSPIFGNGNFVVMAPDATEVDPVFPTIPYFPLEAVVYQQQASNPMTAPLNVLAGGNSGEQVISSVQTSKDYTGTARVLMGNQQTGQ